MLRVNFLIISKMHMKQQLKLVIKYKFHEYVARKQKEPTLKHQIPRSGLESQLLFNLLIILIELKTRVNDRFKKIIPLEGLILNNKDAYNIEKCRNHY